MTLFTYPTRVHFADDILEEALHSEMERAGIRTALTICDGSLADSEFQDRVRAGLPRGCKPIMCQIGHQSGLSELAQSMRNDPELMQVDAVVAFGTARALEMGRKARRAVQDLRGERPAFFAIPGIDGLPDPCTRNLESWRSGLPSVLICDPTLTLSATPGQTMRTAVVSLVRCIESYLNTAYNPPADGMALDGFNRCLTTLPDLGEGTEIAARRDLMAACLNAAMAQEKGVGPAQLLSTALAAECAAVVPADAARLILPGIVGATGRDSRRTETLLRVMGLESHSLSEALRDLLARFPTLPRLSEMGVTHRQIQAAIRVVAGRDDITEPAAEAVLEAVY